MLDNRFVHEFLLSFINWLIIVLIIYRYENDYKYKAMDGEHPNNNNNKKV